MGKDFLTANVMNQTSLYMVVKEDEGDFRCVAPGDSSNPKIRSVDGVGIVQEASGNRLCTEACLATFGRSGMEQLVP
jgi:hypothetical protein